jgi:hypothetical protein
VQVLAQRREHRLPHLGNRVAGEQAGSSLDEISERDTGAAVLGVSRMPI